MLNFRPERFKIDFMKKLLFTGFLFSFLLTQHAVFSQNATNKEIKKRPKVGLVLSGGGAKGFAYIGLFKVLKEIGLHIDYVGGASIGSIMAGFYSAGYDPDTLTDIVSRVNWDEVMQDKVKRKYIPFIDKDMGNQLIVQLPIGKKDKPKGDKGSIISLKKSLYKGQNVEMLLNRYFAKFYKQKDFTKMPVPMFCTGTDLLTGESVILKNGNLEKAIRASMSIPGYFEPVHYQNRYLVDGGVVNNYPAKDMRELGANYIIGGDVQQGLIKDIDKLDNVFSVISQIISFSAVQASEEGMKNTDLYIHFDMGPYDMMSFNDYDSIIAIGEKTARAHYDELKRLNDSLNAIEYVPGNDFSTKFLDSIEVANVEFKGLSNVSHRLMENTFRKLKKKNISLDELEEVIQSLYGSGFFDLVTYEFKEPSEQEKKEARKTGIKDPVDLVINVQEKEVGTLAAGIHYDSDYDIGLLFNAYFRNLLINGSKLFVNFNLSQNLNFKFTYLMDRGPRPGLGITGHFYTFSFGDYEMDKKVNELKFTNYMGSVYALSNIDNQYNLSLGLDYEYFKLDQNIQSDTTVNQFTNFNSYLTPFASFKMDTWDKEHFATKGSKFNVRAEYVMPLSKTWVKDIFRNTFLIYGSWDGNFSLDKKGKFVLQPSAFAGFTIKADNNQVPPINHWFGLGGLNRFNYQNTIVPFMGTKFIQSFGTNMVKTSLAIQYNVYKKLYVTVRDDLGTIWGLADTYDTDGNLELPLINGYGLTVGYDSFIGPAELTIMGSNIYGFSAFLSVGYWF